MAAVLSAPSANVTSTNPELINSSLIVSVNNATFKSGSSVSFRVVFNFKTGMAFSSFLSFLYFFRNAKNFLLTRTFFVVFTATSRNSSSEIDPACLNPVFSVEGSIIVVVVPHPASSIAETAVPRINVFFIVPLLFNLLLLS